MGLVRLLLAMAVVLGHSTSFFGISLTGGRGAVECFFVISGFYMAMVLEKKYFKVKRPWTTFIVARTFRLFPVYSVVLATTVVAASLGAHVYIDNGPQLQLTPAVLAPSALVILGAANLLVVGQDALLFVGVDHGQLHWVLNYNTVPLPAFRFLYVPQAWSISLELMFYLLAPFLMRLKIRTLATLLVASLACRAALIALGLNYDPWTYRFFPAELAYFLAGAIAYKATRGRRWKGPLASPWLLVAVVSVLVAYQAIRGLPLVPALFPLFFAFAIPPLFELTKRSAVDRWVGELSYPLYLVHLLVLGVLLHFGAPMSGWSLLLVSIPVSVFLALLIDRPVDAWRQRRVTSALAQSGAAGAEAGSGVTPHTADGP